MTTPRLRAVGVTKSYGPRIVLDELNIEIGPGSVIAMTGHNGSGKSTFLRCVAGLANHEGTILVDGEESSTVRDRIGYLPQSPGFPGWATVREVIAFFARLRRVGPESHPFEHDFLPDPDQPVRVLSGGQRQRVALAVAMLGRPRLVLLDEPAASLDDRGREAMERTILDLAAAGVSFLYATPRADDLGRVFDRVVCLSEGRLEERPDGTVTTLKAVKP